MPFKRSFLKRGSRVFRSKRRYGSTTIRTPRAPAALPGGRLSRDGETFTLETAFPASMSTQNPRTLTITQSNIVEGYLTSSVLAATNTSIIFSFSQMPQASALAAVFDQYRIDSVELWIYPQVSAAASLTSGTMASAIDLNDSTPITIAQLEQYPTLVSGPCKVGHYRHFVPRMDMAAANGNAFTQFTSVTPQWIDTSSPSVSHYGVKFTVGVTSAVAVFDIKQRFTVSLRTIQ